jgi:hypothetical protein
MWLGFSRLAAAEEDRTLARLRSLRSDLIDPTIAVHKGRVVKRTGDGLLVEFRSVVDAVRCAIEVQHSMIERRRADSDRPRQFALVRRQGGAGVLRDFRGPLLVAEAALAPPRNGVIEIAGPERAPFNEIIARYLKAVGDPRQVVGDPAAQYWGGRVEERSLVPLSEARLGRIGLEEWLRRSQAAA